LLEPEVLHHLRSPSTLLLGAVRLVHQPKNKVVLLVVVLWKRVKQWQYEPWKSFFDHRHHHQRWQQHGLLALVFQFLEFDVVGCSLVG
jgi:hypothetical protein